MDYRPPSFRVPQEYNGSLDGVFEQYRQLKAQQDQMGRQDTIDTLQYGTPLRGLTQDQLQRGAQGPTMTPAVPAGPMPTNMVEMQRPAQPAQEQFDNDPHVAAIQRFIQTKRQGAGQQTRLVESEINKNNRAPVGGAGAFGGNRPPPGYRFLPDGDLEAIPGGPADAKLQAKDEKTESSRQAAVKQAGRIIETIDSALGKVGMTSTGLGSYMAGIPGTKARDLRSEITTIKANLGFAELQAMRQASPTGGALGQVAVQELEALQATVASLDQGQSDEQLERNLRKVRQHYAAWTEAVNGASSQGQPAGGAGSPVPSVGAGGSVRVKLPDGREGNIPAANLDAAIKRGARRL